MSIKQINATRRRSFSAGIIILVIFILSPQNIIHSQYLDSDFRGQLSGWTTINPKQAPLLGVRYIPIFSLAKESESGYLFDSEISLNTYGSMTWHDTENIEFDSRLKLYRGWLRFSGDQYEIRLGLQKINFGSASILRPLMWFDSIDPRDPLQITDGVYGILGRYFFLNNANIWLWGLYGNDKTRGWEVLSTDKGKPEYGGRIQYPLLNGQFALTYHHRSIDLQRSGIPEILITNEQSSENKFGIDGKWDAVVGLWFEGVITKKKLAIIDITIPGIIDANQFKYQQMVNTGIDYTFDIGNGLYGAAEYFTMQFSGELFGKGEKNTMAALTFNYPINILDNISTMIYYHWDEKEWYRFLNWQRTYDNWSFYLMAFWNPAQFQIYESPDTSTPFAGKGVQFMVVFNH